MEPLNPRACRPNATLSLQSLASHQQAQMTMLVLPKHRKGNPHLENDLRRVSVETARAIVVLSTCDHADQVCTLFIYVVLTSFTSCATS